MVHCYCCLQPGHVAGTWHSALPTICKCLFLSGPASGYRYPREQRLVHSASLSSKGKIKGQKLTG